MQMYNLLEYSGNYAKKVASCRDETDDNITDCKSFKFKSSITDNSNNAGVPNVNIVAPLKYLSNFRRTLEILLINCEVSLDLHWSENCVICEAIVICYCNN